MPATIKNSAAGRKRWLGGIIRVIFWSIITLSALPTLGACVAQREASTVGTVAHGQRIPGKEVVPAFPWPPPRASSSQIIPRAFVTGEKDSTLGNVASHLMVALEDAGYSERSFYPVPGGFALVARLEQINVDGSPKDGSSRWVVAEDKIEMQNFSLVRYINALFIAPEGYFRVITFVISDKPFAQGDESPTRDEASEWLFSGWNILPNNIAAMEFDDRFNCTVLIYEFQNFRIPEIVAPGRLLAKVHLQRSGLWAAMQKW